jgi:SAM-dependent methyltransferase
MNEVHLEMLASDDWRAVLRDLAFPFAFKGIAVEDLGDDVLEIGPGPGLTTDLLTAALPAITSIEIDDDLADALAARVDADRVTVVNGDATDMPFDDGRFSGVSCFTMFHHVPTVAAQDRMLAEVARVLRPGGLFVANDSVASDDLAGLHDGDVYNPVDPATLPDRLAAAGFVDVEVRTNPYAWAAHARCPV